MQYQQAAEQLKGKTVLVTGHTGFKGSWLSIWLQEMGCKVVGYALPPEQSEGCFVKSGVENCLTESCMGDIRDFDSLYSLMQKHRPEVVFHLAAQPLVRESYLTPRETYEVNVMGTVNVLEAVRRLEQDTVAVMITTDKCYENKEWCWGYRENDQLGGHDPYSNSKGCCELAIKSYRESFFEGSPFHKQVASVRAGNVIGGGDWAKDRIVPDCIRSLREKKPILVRNPLAVRPWQHVLEPLWGYLMLAASMCRDPQMQGEAWNFGPEMESCVPVGEIVDKIVKLWGSGSWQDVRESNAPRETNFLRLDHSKATVRLGWSPVWNIDEGLQKTMEWYRQAPETNAFELCREQIQSYISRI